VPVEKFKPINTTRVKLDELKAKIWGLNDNTEKMTEALAFIEANKAPDTTPVAAAAAAGASEGKKLAEETGDLVKKTAGDTVKWWLWLDKKTLLDDFQKKAKGEALDLWPSFRLMLVWFISKNEGLSRFLGKIGLNFMEWWTPEELKLAGIAPKSWPKPKEDEVKWPEKWKENNFKYVASVDMLLKFWQNREERSENVLGNAGQLLKEPKFNMLSIATLRKGYNLITKKFDISLLPEQDKWVINSIPMEASQREKALNLIARLFLDTSNSIQSQVSASLLKWWDTVSLRTSILSGSQNLRKFTPFGSIDISNPQAMIQEGAGKYIPTIDPQSKELTGELAEDFNASMWKKNALWIFGSTRDRAVPLDIIGIESHFQTNNPDLSKDPEDQIKLKKILTFGVDLRTTIANSPTINLWEWPAVSKAIANTFTLSDLGILYTFLDGKSDVTTMNSLEKWFLIMKVADMVGVSDKVLFWKYSTAIVNALLWHESPIDPGVKGVFSDMLWYATDKTWNTIADMAQVIWWSAQKNPWVAVWLIAATLFGPWFPKRGALVWPLRR
jgi:hypothetical protein